MCGIAGIGSQQGLALERRGWLPTALDALRHRGPDSSGEWWSDDGRVGLAHRRLSIIDLSPAGHQPMHDGHGRTIVFNGEIYNFAELRSTLAAKGVTFHSQSDTEVLLAAYAEWGPDCLSHLNGMFAFAIHDAQRQTMFLARDRAGEKPLYYHYDHGTLRFASELKGLLADTTLPRRIDEAALDCYLAMGFVPGACCILHGFNKLPPAHAMQFDMSTGTLRQWRYWQLPELEASSLDGQPSEADLLDELELLLEDAVRRQLVADVPVGVLLSGGVDSSLVTAMAARASHNIRTFTICFPGHGRFDEAEHARLIARHFHTEHTELEARPPNADLLLRLAKQIDEPMVDSSMIPTFLVSELVRKHCTVALGGDGGDELFGGYRHYTLLLSMQRRMGRIPRLLRSWVARGAEYLLPIGFRGRAWLRIAANLQMASLFDPVTRKALLSGRGDWPLVGEGVKNEFTPPSTDLLQRTTRLDFTSYLPEDILVKVDRTSMLNSLELRSPLLDYRLVEFAFAKVSSRLKATPTSKKILLKRLTARVLPAEFDRERKQGFSIPLANWLNTVELRQLFHDALLDSTSIFDRQTVRKMLRGQERGRKNSERLFGLVMFELWRRQYQVSI